jgi:hypothetical protein
VHLLNLVKSFASVKTVTGAAGVVGKGASRSFLSIRGGSRTGIKDQLKLNI